MEILNKKEIYHRRNISRGQSLVEVLFAIAIFIIGVFTVGFLLIDSQTSLRFSIEMAKASLLAQEGIEALYGLRDGNFDNLVAGVHGIVFEGGVVALASSSDMVGKFSRAVSIVDVDDKTKEVTSTVSWTVRGSRTASTTMSGYITDWKQSDGESMYMAITIDEATLASSSTALSSIQFENVGPQDITITDMQVQWNGLATLESVTIDGTLVFTVSTSTSVVSGEDFNISDYTLAFGAGEKTIDNITFSAPVSGTDFIVTFVLNDGSRKHVLIEI